MLLDTPDRGGGGSVSDCEISVEISSCHTVLSYWSSHNELTGQTGDLIYGSYKIQINLLIIQNWLPSKTKWHEEDVFQF